MTQEGQIFSSTGECRPFDVKSNGTVPADAVVAILWKRLVEPYGNGGIYATIAGAEIGSDDATGKAGYQVPSPQGQATVIERAWEDAGMKPEAASYFE